MEKEFVPRQLSLELKELGFNKPCLAIYSNADPKTGLYTLKKYNLKLIKRKSQIDKGIPAPTWQSAFEWFRKKHKLWNMIYPRDGWNYSIQKMDKTISCTGESWHNVEIKSYERAELACLTKLIELVKNK